MLTKQDGKGNEVPESIEHIKNMKMEKQDQLRKALEESSAKKRQLRQWHIEQREAAEAEKVQRTKEAEDRKVRQIERTQRLAEELARRKHIELQESLKSRKAKSAVPAIASQQVKKIETELAEIKKHDAKLQSSEEDRAWHFTEIPAATLQERKLNYKRDLQKQLIDNRRRLLTKEEEKHRERKIMEEVGEAMHKENVEMEKRKQATIALLQAERNAFLKARKFWKEKRREVLKQEYDEIARIIAKREALQKSEAERKSDNLATKSTTERLSKKLIEEERKKTEREEICRELYIVEQENEIAHDEMRRVLKKKRTARELLQDMARYQKSTAEKKAKERAIDAAFAKYVADERKKQEEKEREKEQARREKFIQYGNELRETIMKNSVQRAKEAAQMKPQISKPDHEKPKSKYHSEPNLETLQSYKAKNYL